MQIAVGGAHRRRHDCDDHQRGQQQSRRAKQLRQVALEHDDHDLIKVTRPCANVRVGQGLAALGQAPRQIGFADGDRLAIDLHLVVEGTVGAWLGHGIKHLAAQADQHHAKQKTGRQAKRENDRAAPERLGRLGRVKAHPLRRLDHRAKRAEDAECEQFLRRERAGGAGDGEGRARQLGDFREKSGRPAQGSHGGGTGKQHPAHQQRALQRIGPRNAAHAADHDVKHRHERQQAGADLERVFAAEELARNDPARLDLDDDVRHGIEKTDQRHEAPQRHRAAVVAADQVGRGDVAVRAPEFADAIAEHINHRAAQRDVQREQREHHAFLVHHPRRAQHRRRAEKRGHDRQRRKHPALAAPGEVVVLLAGLAFAETPEADPEQKKQIPREAEVREPAKVSCRGGVHHSSLGFQMVKQAVTTTAACTPYQNSPQA